LFNRKLSKLQIFSSESFCYVDGAEIPVIIRTRNKTRAG